MKEGCIALVEDARPALERWSRAGYEIHLLTGRPPTTENATRDWLATHAIPHVQLDFVDKYGRAHTWGEDVDVLDLNDVKQLQFGQAPHFALLLGFLFLNTAFFQPAEFQRRMEALTVGWEMGKKAESLFGRNWPSLWHMPISDVRTSLELDADPVVVDEGIRAAA